MELDTGLRAQPPLLEYFLGKLSVTEPAAPTASAPAPGISTSETASSTTNNDGNTETSHPPPSQPTNQQTESSFFTRLPSEIRRMIYVEVWRTYGSDGYGDAGNGDKSNGTGTNGTNGNDTHPHAHMTTRGGLSPHITAVMMPLPLPRPTTTSVSDGEQSQPPSPPWRRQMGGFTSAPCFLAVDHGEDDDEQDARTRRDSLMARAQKRPPEADDVRPERLAAAHRADLDAVAASNSIYENSDTGTPSSAWRARWNSPWLGHWVCEEYYSGAAQPAPSTEAATTATTSSDAVHSHSHRRRRPPLRRPYLPILLSCRRAYTEGIDLLYSALTFQFTEMATAQRFLERWPCVASVRLVMHLSNSLLELYLRPDDTDQAIITAGEAPPEQEHNPGPGAVTIGTFPRQDERDMAQPSSGTVINARNNAWQRLCDGLAADRLPNLKRLHVWVEAHDLRGWPKTAAETRLFAQLLAAGTSQRRLTPERFVLYLPTLPALGDKARELPGCYLGEEDEGQEPVKATSRGGEGNDGNEAEESTSKGKKVAAVERPPLPCTIVRTERPDYWDVHMHMRPVYVNRRMSVGSRVSALRRAGFL